MMAPLVVLVLVVLFYVLPFWWAIAGAYLLVGLIGLAVVYGGTKPPTPRR